jgi:3-methyladenine DNA glycosylase Mpg
MGKCVELGDGFHGGVLLRGLSEGEGKKKKRDRERERQAIELAAGPSLAPL